MRSGGGSAKDEDLRSTNGPLKIYASTQGAGPRFVCSARGRAFVRSARERQDIGCGPSAHAFLVFCSYFSFLKVFLTLFFTDLLAFFSLLVFSVSLGDFLTFNKI
jgi:hypothetical protein